MAINNNLKLIGFMNKEGVRIIETEDNYFGAFSMATNDSYKDKETEEWKDKKTIWHDLVVYNPAVISILKGLNSKAKIQVIATLDYRPLPVQIEEEENGEIITKVITKKEANLIARKVEQIPLNKKK